MQLQAGIGAGDSTSPLNFVEVIKVDSKRRVGLDILDADGNPTDISEAMLPSGESDGYLELNLTSLSETEVFAETYWPNVVPSARRIKKLSTGKYYVTLGDESGETDSTGTYVANWTARIDEDSEEMYATNVIEVVSSRVLSLLPRFNMQINRSWKVVDVESACLLGYTSPMLVMFLRSALEMINSYQPSAQFYNLDMFPIEQYGQTLIEVATYIALESQMLFALDTDLPNYNSSGHAFTLAHQQPLAAYLGQLRASLDSKIPKFKMHFLRSGTCKVCYAPSLAFSSLLSAAPWGANFRGIWTAR